IEDLRVPAQQFDAIVVAVGGRWERPDIPGVDAPWVRTVDDLDPWLLAGEPLDGRRVVVLGGGRAGCGLADLASRQGYEVTIVEPGPVLAWQIGLPGRWRLVHDLWERNVDTRLRTETTRIDDHTVYVTSADGDDELHA